MVRRGKNGNESIYVPTQNGRLVQRSTGTTNRQIVRGMKRMLVDLKDRATVSGRWTLLEAVRATRLTLTELYVAYAANGLAVLEARLEAKNLAEHLDGWIQWVRANRREEVRTADVYWQQVTTLVVPGVAFLASELTKARVTSWLTARTGASPGTRRKYFYALKSFVQYLIDLGVLETDPLAGLKAPKMNPPRERWETIARDKAIVDAASPEYRAFFACIKAVGCDVGAARKAQKGDFTIAADGRSGWLNTRGTKTAHRSVHGAEIEPWALPYLIAHLRGFVGQHARVFATLPTEGHRGRTGRSRGQPGNSGPAHHHRRCCDAVGVENYTLKDSRHSVAVRMRKAGRTFEEIAGQLGTSVYQVVQVYSKYQPDAASTTTDRTTRPRIMRGR